MLCPREITSSKEETFLTVDRLYFVFTLIKLSIFFISTSSSSLSMKYILELFVASRGSKRVTYFAAAF